MATSKIVKFGLETRAIELKNQRKSDYQIADILTNESGKKISRDNVYNYFRTHYKILKLLAEEDAKFQKEMLRQHLEVNAQLARVSQKAWATIEKLEADDPARVAPLLSVILHQVEIVCKRAGEISDAPQITIINQEFNKFQESVLSIVEEEGGRELRERILRRV